MLQFYIYAGCLIIIVMSFGLALQARHDKRGAIITLGLWTACGALGSAVGISLYLVGLI